MRAGVFLLTAITAAWLLHPVLLRMVRARMPAPLPQPAPRWVSPAVIAAGSGLFAGAAGLLPAPLVLSVTLAVAGVISWWLVCIDAAIHRLPDPLVAALGATLLAGYLALVLLGQAQPGDLTRAVLAGAGWGAVFAALALARPRSLGFGDVKLTAALGVGVGWFGWAATGQWIALSFLLGGGYALVALIARRLGTQDRIAFGPWLILAAAAAIALAAAAGVPH